MELELACSTPVELAEAFCTLANTPACPSRGRGDQASDASYCEVVAMERESD